MSKTSAVGYLSPGLSESGAIPVVVNSAEVFDIQASESGFVDISEKSNEVINEGADLIYDETTGIYLGDFDGNSSLYVPLNSSEHTAITKEVSLEVDQERGSLNLSVVNDIGKKLPITGSYVVPVLMGIGVTMVLVSFKNKQKDHE